MNKIPETVLIVGAGPTGMMAALDLSRFGIPVRLIEKTPQPATTSRAVGVQARTLELLELRGLAASLIALGNPGMAASIYGDSKRIFRLDFQHLNSKYHYLLFVSQAETERILREALSCLGVIVERGVTMIGFGQADHLTNMTAVLQHKDGELETFECAYIIDAEGAHSTARTTLGLEFEGRSLVEDYALGDLYIEGDLVETDFHIFSSEYGFMGLFPLGNRRFRLIASNPISKPSKDTAPSLEELQQIYNQRSHITSRFHDLSWSSWFRINSRMIHQMRVARVFLGGDSAHIHSPAGAQGMNTGMQDMINLAWKLAMVIKGQARPELLDTYSAERVPVINDVLSKTEALTHAIGSENTLFRSVFKHLAPWLVSIDAVQHNSTQRMSQLAINYRHSPLSASSGHSGTLRAGDRIPDLPVTVVKREASPGLQPTTIFALLDPSVFTLLYSNIPDPTKTHSEIHEVLGSWHYLMRGHQIAACEGEDSFAKLFGSSPSIILVRPDGYVAFTGTDQSLPELVKFCQKWLVSQPSSIIKESTHA